MQVIRVYGDESGDTRLEEVEFPGGYPGRRPAHRVV